MKQNKTPSWDVLPHPEETPTADLSLHPDNPRTITDGNFEALKESMRQDPELMKYKPLLMLDGMVYAGNQRLKAARELGWETIPTVNLQYCSQAARERLLIIDNIPYGAWDKAKLEQRWIEIVENAWIPPDVDVTWIKTPEEDLDPNDVQEDNFEPNLEGQTDIQEGDLYQIGPHRLLCGDATSMRSWNQLMRENRANCLITDPPYNVDYEGSAGMKILGDKMEDSAFRQFLTISLGNSNIFMREGAAAYVFHADSEGLNFRMAYEGGGYMLKQCLIWVKKTFTIGRQDYQWQHEPILYGWKPGAAHYFTHHRDQGTVLPDPTKLNTYTKTALIDLIKEITQEAETTILHENKPKRNALHPTMKPLKLVAKLIRNSTRQDQLIIDPFLGSGSTMVAAHQMNRTVFGMDLDPRYCQAVIDRMRKQDPEIRITKID